MNSPYEPPAPLADSVATTSGPPPVWKWYVAYCILMAAMYLAFLVGGTVLYLFAAELSDGEREAWIVFRIQGAVLAVIGIVFSMLFAIAPLLPKRKSAWIYGFVTIGLGMTSACCLPATIPLLIFWIKDDCKRFFSV